MAPVFLPDDYVIGIGWWRPVCHLWHLCLRRPPYRPGDVLLIRHPTCGRIIKRVTGISTAHSAADTHYTLAGDNVTHTISSSEIGSVPMQNIIGKVIFHIRKPRSSQPGSSRHTL